MIELEELEVESYVAGLDTSGPVMVIYVKHTGDGACTVKYDLADGSDDDERLSLVSATCTWAFDATPQAFKLAAEALRIQLAHIFDPMMAVTSWPEIVKGSQEAGRLGEQLGLLGAET